MGRSATEDDIRRIYRETVDTLYGFVSRRCGGDRDLAEDVTQETWLRAVRAWREDGVPERPLAWLSTVAARLLSNHRRRPAAERLDDGAGGALPAADDGASRDRSERRSLVERAMARLPVPQGRPGTSWCGGCGRRSSASTRRSRSRPCAWRRSGSP